MNNCKTVLYYFITASSDFQSLTSLELVFPAGSEAGSTQSFSVGIIDDDVVEGSEQFSLTIMDSTANAEPISGQDLATVAIIDNDFGMFIYIPM